MKRTAFLLLAFLLTAIAAPAQAPPPPLISPEVHADKSVTFRFRGPNVKEVAISLADPFAGAKGEEEVGLLRSE